MDLPGLSAIQRAVRRGDDPNAPLALADWLEEHGQTEADLARSEHVRLEALAGSSRVCGQAWVEERLQTLSQAHGPAWLGKAHGLRGVPRWSLERGLTWLWLRPSILKKGRLEHVAHLAAGGWLAGLRCEGWGKKPLARLLRSPLLAGIAALDLMSCVPPIGALASSPHLASLERLRLASCGLGPREMARLARSQSLLSLEVLEAPFNRAGSAGTASLARSSLMPRLRRLDLEGNRVGPRGARALARAAPPGLHLKLPFNRLRCRGARILAEWPGLAALGSLDLGYNGIGPEGGAALASVPALPPLRIDGNDLGPAHALLHRR